MAGGELLGSVAKQNFILASIYAGLVPALGFVWPLLWERALGGSKENRVRRRLAKHATYWGLFVLIGQCSAVQYVRWFAFNPEDFLVAPAKRHCCD